MSTKIKKPSSLKKTQRFHVCSDHKWATHSESPSRRRGYKDDWRAVGGQRTLNRKEKLIMTERREDATGAHQD